MQSTRKFRLTGLALKVASVAVAVAAVSVYATHTPSRAGEVGRAQVSGPPASQKAPRAVIRASEVWSADESAAGLRPDAAH